MGSIRIFIASACEDLRLSLLVYLVGRPGMGVVGLSDRLADLLTQLEGSEPDVLLLDWVSPVQSLADLLTDLDDLAHRPKVIILSNKPEEKEKIMAYGADYFIPKDAPPDDLLPILNDLRLSKSKT